jgi:dipeptidyl aminopeptidase/acylaminoacyl peptidase
MLSRPRRVFHSTLGCSFILATGLAGQAKPSELTREDYAAAVRVLEGNLRGLVKNQAVDPHWIGTLGAFWYRRDEATGTSYVKVDPAGRKSPLFDHAALAAALGRALGGETPPTAAALGLTDVALTDDQGTLTGASGGKRVSCNLKAMTCAPADVKAPEPGLLVSPDGKRAAMIRSFNLVVRDLTTGRDSAITTDGAAYYGYGSLTDQSLISIPLRKSKAAFPPFATSWSPDGRYLVSVRTDERDVRVNPFVEWVPQDGSLRPIYWDVRSAFTGDKEQIKSQLFVFDLSTGRAIPVMAPATLPALSADPVGWSEARGQVFLIARAEGSKSVGLFRVDLATGQGTVVFDESLPTRVETNTVEYNQPNVRILNDGAEAVWYSARSGFGHLYRYDATTGALLNPITAGDWGVMDLLAVDSKRREIYFTGGGREAGRDPYYRHLYKARLDGTATTLLTDADADHHFDPPRTPMLKLLFRSVDPAPLIRPDVGVFLDTYSTVSTPPVTVLRRTADGKIIAEIERADASALFAAGWKPPVRERVRAADGTTDLYAVYYAPGRDIGSSKHPVIDAEYGGPQVTVAPKNFIEAYSASNPLGESGLARLGFAMVTVDGRGTPNRSRAFRDAGYPEFTQVGIDDHIATIKELATRHPEMDPTRVGVYGISWGGTFAAQAILSRPKFYHVAVSGAGVYNYAPLYGGFGSFTGVPQYADGSVYRTKPGEMPSNWQKLDITAMAPNLEGHLMFTYGDLDENVPSSQVFRMIDALIKANKPYDLVYLPGRNHGGNADPYAIRRTWDYFLQYLLGVTPLPDVVVTVKPVSPL